MQALFDVHTEIEWNEWMNRAPHTAPLQSWNWKKAQENAGKIVHTISVVDSTGKTITQTLVIVEPLGLGRYMAVSPRGPVFDEVGSVPQQEALAVIASCIKASIPNVIVWRAEPAGICSIDDVAAIEQQQSLLVRAGATHVYDRQPAITRMLELTVGLPALLAAMKQKTRYNIRLSAKKGVVTQWYERTTATEQEWQQLVQQWWALQQQTAQRQGIRVQPRRYFDALLNAPFAPQSLYIGVARVGDAIAAMNINLVAGDTMTYLFGASSHVYRETMAPYGLQWSGIEIAHNAGLRYYDFYGVAPEGLTSQHRLAGVTRFKEGFGGALYAYPGTWEFPISGLWYRMYRLAQRLRS